jgi:PBSX family phage terminase large subunit
MKRINIDINECYSPYLNNQTPILLLFGSAGSGKSVFTCQKLVLRMLTEKNHKFLAIRKIYATLRTSCYAELKTVIDRAGISSYFTMGLSPLSITCKSTKSSIIFRGIDDTEKIKSISGITGIWVEEANELTEDEFDQLQLRLRGETNYYKQTIVTFNPVIETHWLKKRYFDLQLDGVVRKKTTYLDNAFIGSEYAAKLEQLKQTNPKYYRVYALGEWGKITTGAEFYRNWNISNVANNTYNADNPIHISFDFNVVPYCTAIISQIQKTGQGYQLNIINEYCLPYPKNNTQSLCQSILADYSDNAKIFIYGDPAGNSRDTRSSGSDYTIIFKELKQLNPVNKVASYAPRLSYRNIFTNLIMANAINTITLAVDPKCKNLIKDFEEVTEAADGSKLKKRITDKATGQSYEPIGHTSDAFDYLVCQLFKNEFNAIQGKKGGIYAG